MPFQFRRLDDTSNQRNSKRNRLFFAALPHILKNHEGAIVNISSVNAQMPELLLPIYGTTKAALNNLTKMLAGEFGPRRIRVNSISPGPVVTPLRQDPENGMAKTISSMAAMDAEKCLKSCLKWVVSHWGNLQWKAPSQQGALCNRSLYSLYSCLQLFKPRQVNQVMGKGIFVHAAVVIDCAGEFL